MRSASDTASIAICNAEPRSRSSGPLTPSIGLTCTPRRLTSNWPKRNAPQSGLLVLSTRLTRTFDDSSSDVSIGTGRNEANGCDRCLSGCARSRMPVTIRASESGYRQPRYNPAKLNRCFCTDAKRYRSRKEAASPKDAMGRAAVDTSIATK